jgi:hypothetical protein
MTLTLAEFARSIDSFVLVAIGVAMIVSAIRTGRAS